MTFEEMAAFTPPQEKVPELKRLGILRMDVDNLGSIFQTRGQAPGWSLAAASSLSYALDYFFRGKLDRIWKKHHASCCTQILYAGGDDLFVLGRWDAVLSLADEIRKQFGAWTGEGSPVTLSGGMAIVSDKYPLARAAEEAADAEHMAKHHKYEDQELKNAFAVLGQSFHWEHEWQYLDALRQELAQLYEKQDDRVPEGLLARLYQHADRAREAQLAYDNPQTRSQNTLAQYRWRWQLAYDLGRLLDRLPEDATQARELVNQLRKAAMYDPPISQWREAAAPNGKAHSEKPFIHYAGTAARLVALQRRMNP
jgi:CRISPR-associated protein Csm1